jgi:hypothetical protein
MAGFYGPNDKVLVGIVLGYGQENALYESRIEDVATYLTAVEDIPLKHEKYSPEKQLKGFFLPKCVKELSLDRTEHKVIYWPKSSDYTIL